MHGWTVDIRSAVRALRKNPEIYGVAIFAMALAIGATSTVFSVVDGVVLHPLPYDDADRLVAVWQIDPAHPDTWVQTSAGNFADWRNLNSSLETTAAAVNASVTFTDFEDPETPLVRRVSHDYFDVLGIQPALGRGFAADEDRAGGPAVTVLSHELWQRRFAGDPDVLGRTIGLDGVPHEIVGVMPADFVATFIGLAETPKLWLPLADPASGLDRGRRRYVVVARLRDGVSVEQARDDLQGVSLALREQYPEQLAQVEALVTPLAERSIRQVRPALLLLFAAVACVLLVAGGNVANLLLSRTLERRRELALRRALGARAGRILRQLTVESLVLTLLCAGLGLLLAAWGTGTVNLLVPAGGFNMPDLDTGVSARVLLFTLGLALLTGLVFGAVPATYALRLRLDDALSAGAVRSVGERRSRRLQRALVVAEVAVSLMLLIGAGLMVRSFASLQQLDPGFDADNLLTFRVSTRGPEYGTPEAREAFFRQVNERIREQSGVVASGASQALPFFPQFATLPASVDSAPSEPGHEPRVAVRRSTPDYLSTLRVPLLRGRTLEAMDTMASPAVAVISRTAAVELWGQRDPLGDSLTLIDASPGGRSLRVVGIVGDTRSDGVPPEPQPVVYIPLAQDAAPVTSMGYAVRTSGYPLSYLPAVQRAVARVDRGMPVYLVASMDQVIERMDWRSRLTMVLLASFAFLALVLAATGMYAVLSYTVSRRTREIGIRMALGAHRDDVVALVLRGAGKLAVFGIGLGLAGAVALSRFLSSQLYGISATDPATYGALAGLLAGVVLLAGFVPARRATHVDPVTALQQD